MYEARLRHAQHYAEKVTQQSKKPADYAWIDADLGQLQQVQSHLGFHDDDTSAQILVSITENVALAMYNYGQRVQMLEWCNRALSVADRIDHDSGSLLIAKGRLESALGNIDGATEAYQKAVAGSDPTSLAYAQALLALSGITLNRGEYQGVRDQLGDIAALLREHGHDDYVVLVDYQNAMYDFRHGNFEAALSTFLDLDNRLRDNPTLASLYPGTEVTELQYTVWFAIGCIYRKLAIGSMRGRQHYYEKALHYLHRLHEESKARIHSEMQAASAHHIGWVYLNQGQREQALMFAHTSQNVYEKLNRVAGMADVYEQIGLIHIAMGQPEHGLFYVQRSFDLRTQIENKHGAASSVRRVAIAQFHLKQWWQSFASLVRSIQMYQSMGVLGMKRVIGISLELLEWTIGRKRFTL
jgi:tetratricopeptide (TPR) repeat protein